MNRYLLFVGEYYEAEGGFNDLIGLFDSVENALNFIPREYDWYHIVDTKIMKIIKEGEIE